MKTIEKLQYEKKANIPNAEIELEQRLSSKEKLDIFGINNESIYLTGIEILNSKLKKIKELYKRIPVSGRVSSVILLDSYSSATIEGARTTVEKVKKCINNPKTNDDIMVINTIKGCHYAYKNIINEKNIRELWEIIVDKVCENLNVKGKKYRSGMVHVGNEVSTIHTPPDEKKVIPMMKKLFSFYNTSKLDPIIKSIVFHFYFVYVHPFCDGNGRTARCIHASQLYHENYPKMKSVSLATSINANLKAYYKSIEKSEKVIQDKNKWIDISPFVDYMLDIMDKAITNCILAQNKLDDIDKKILSLMNKKGYNAEITVKKVNEVLSIPESTARKHLNELASNGFLSIEKRKENIYKLISTL